MTFLGVGGVQYQQPSLVGPMASPFLFFFFFSSSFLSFRNIILLDLIVVRSVPLQPTRWTHGGRLFRCVFFFSSSVQISCIIACFFYIFWARGVRHLHCVGPSFASFLFFVLLSVVLIDRSLGFFGGGWILSVFATTAALNNTLGSMTVVSFFLFFNFVSGSLPCLF